MIYWYDIELMMIAVMIPMNIMRNKYGITVIDNRLWLLLIIPATIMWQLSGAAQYFGWEYNIHQFKQLLIASSLCGLMSAILIMCFPDSIISPLRNKR
jgi:hypothetical protein